MLKSLGLRNFKSIGEEIQTVSLAPITLLFGPNSAGKSTVLQALIYLKEIVNSRNFNPDHTELGGEWLDLGGFKNVIHAHDIDKSMEFIATLSLEGSELPQYVSPYEAELLEEVGYPATTDVFEKVIETTVKLTLKWSQILKKVIVVEYSCNLNNCPVATVNSSMDGRQVNIGALPLAFEGLQSPQDYLLDEDSIFGMLSKQLNTSAFDQKLDDINNERVFKNDSIDEIREVLLATEKEGGPSENLLLQIMDELNYRTSRKALQLKQEIERLLSSKSFRTLTNNIGLPSLKNALPDFQAGLTFENDMWIEDDDDENSHNKLLQIFSASVLDAAVCGPLKCLSDWLEDLSYIGPLRDLPSRSIQARNTVSKSRWTKGLAAWEMLPTAPQKMIDEINFWLGEKCLDSGYQVLVNHYRELKSSNPIFAMLEQEMELDDQILIKELIEDLPERVRVSLLEEATDLEVMPQDIGVGISQLFPVIALSVFQKNGLAAIEQPELHIHPKLQVELADMFIRSAKQNNTMFLLETHSEHLMLRLLRRVRESSENIEGKSDGISPNDLSVQYVQSDNGFTRFQTLRVSDDGDFIDPWPSGFFDERDQELFF